MKTVRAKQVNVHLSYFVQLDQHGIIAKFLGGGRNRIGRREKWPKTSWEEGEIGVKSRQKGENVR